MQDAREEVFKSLILEWTPCTVLHYLDTRSLIDFMAPSRGHAVLQNNLVPHAAGRADRSRYASVET